jgi:signal transduction histidine kinase
MKKVNPVQAKLNSLEAVLRNLRSQQLPQETQAELQAADQYLDELSQDLQFSQDHVRLAALYRVSQVMGTSLDLDEVLTQVMDAVIGLTGAERGFLVLLEPGSKEWRLRAARDFSQETLQSQDMVVSRTVINTVINSCRGVVTTDAQSDPRFSQQESVVFYALHSIMCAPLLSRGQIIGAIYVDNRAQTGLFAEDDLDMLNALAVQAAVAIDNARLYTRTDQALTQRVAELETLAQMDRELNASLELNHVVEITYRWAGQEGNATRTWILLTESGVLEGSVVAYPEEFPDLHDKLILRSMAELTPQVSMQVNESTTRLAIPLLYSGKLLGMVILERPAAFAEAEVQFLTHLVGRTAAAIQNARLYQAVQQASEAKTQFISVVTHELRIPMTSIKGYADLLRQGVVGPVNEQQVSFLDVIRNNVERMSVLISDLSDISKIESGKIKLACALIPLKVYIDEALRNLRPKLAEKNQSLEVDIAPDLPQVYADYNRLIQILNNLVSNAWKYSPEGERIHIVAQRQDNLVRVEVIDHGIGISAQDQPHIFTQFFRSEDPVVRNEQGWGLGLSVAKRLVEFMGGNIDFTSVSGQGSTFWFTLPTSEQITGEGADESSKA